MVSAVKALRVISKTLSYLFLGIVVLLAILLVGVRLVGLTPYTVLSGSMEPTYHVGSVIYVAKTDPVNLQEGDPVTYRLSGGTIVTHRIYEVLGEGTSDLSFRTKGDANEDPDSPPLPASAVIGKPLFSVPYLGFVSEFVRQPKGLIVLGGICVAVLILSFAVDALLTEKKAPPGEEDGNPPQDGEPSQS